MTPSRHQIRRGIAAALLIAAVAFSPLVQPATATGTVEIQLLSFSDWHGQIDPLSGAGGASILSTYFQQERTANPNTITITGGDDFGASPPIAGFFDEEPAVETLNLLGLSVSALGNHNFDQGIDHLQDMIDLADYPYVSANLENVEENLDGVAPYVIFDVAGVKVAVIGVTNEDAPSLLAPGSMGSIVVTDDVAAANDARDAAAAEGATVFIAVSHTGVTHRDHGTGQYFGPLVDLANGLEGFDVLIGDHTDFQYSGLINGVLVIENKSKGVTYGRTTLVVDLATGAVVDRFNDFVVPTVAGITPDPVIEAYLAAYREALAEAFDVEIGIATDVFFRGNNVERLGEVPIGNLVTDAIRERYGTQLAFNNGGGIRASFPSSHLPQDHSLRRASPGYAQGPPYDLVVGDVFAVLPFGNSVVTREVTGTQVWQVLEHGVHRLPAPAGLFAQISGMSFTFDSSKPAGERVVSVLWHPDLPAEVKDAAEAQNACEAALKDSIYGGNALYVDLCATYYELKAPCPPQAPSLACTQPLVLKGHPGLPIPRDDQKWTLTTNSFVNAGGDGYAMLADGQGATREVMADIVLEHIQDKGTITPRTEDRIKDLAPLLEDLPAL